MPKKIELSIDDAGNFVMSDGGTTKLGNVVNRDVSWRIKGSGIESFRIAGKSPGDPFTQRPGSGNGTKLDLTVRFLGPTGDWYYSIIWKDTATHTEHPVDPKIAVKPIAVSAKTLIIVIASALVYLLSVQFLRFGRKRNRR